MQALTEIHPPPANIEAEQALLGAILVNNDAWGRVEQIITAADFSEDVHARIFDACSELIADGKRATPISLKGMLQEQDLGGITVFQYLARLASEATTIINAPDYARSIRDFSDRRQIIEIARDASFTAQTAPISLKTSKIASEMVSRLDAIASAGLSMNMRRITIGAAARQAYDRVADIKAGKPIRGILTGLVDIDAMVGALERGQGSILAGRPSMGKTALSLQIAYNVASSGTPVLVHSLEMAGIPLAQRILASIMFDDGYGPPVDYSNINRGLISRSDMERMDAAARELEKIPLYIEQQPGVSMSQIAARTRQLKGQLEADGKELGLFIVDHIGLVAPSGRYRGNPNKELGEISAGVHQLAKETDTHGMMLSQLSRKCEERENKRPQLSDLRESGELEQNGDLIIGAFREAYYLSRLGNGMTHDQQSQLASCQNELEAIVLKQRQGATGTVRLFADMATNSIRGAAR